MKTGEYADKGDYHRILDQNWRYLPVYLEKMQFINSYLKGKQKSKIIDIGCGEGLLVEKYQKHGFTIKGTDYNYSSKYVAKDDITQSKLHDQSFDLILCLDVIEHLSFEQQILATNELFRIVKPSGRVLMSVPNLAHFASRLSFLFTGKLIRTSTIDRHPGDRPMEEYLALFKKTGFEITFIRGLFPTYPIISVLTYLWPSKVVWLHKIYNKFFAYPNWCFQTIIELKK
jgi:2-polyprenyl-3-methyl-5-hydroxy-6-metoxy-1,4-benzoquinol methylase